MGKINKVCIVSLLTVLAVAVFGISVSSKVLIDNVVDLSLDSSTSEEEILYTLSGGSDPTASIRIDDDLVIYLNGNVIFQDLNHVTSLHAPISFYAYPGDSLRIKAIDQQYCAKYISNIYVHFGTVVDKVVVTPESATVPLGGIQDFEAKAISFGPDGEEGTEDDEDVTEVIVGRELLVEEISVSACPNYPNYDPSYHGPWPNVFLDETFILPCAGTADQIEWSLSPIKIGSISPATGSTTTFTATDNPENIGEGTITATVCGKSGSAEIIVASLIDYIKVSPDPVYVCVNGSQQFVAKGYGYGENGERDGDPDPETYAPAGDDTGPESIEVTWATSVTEEVGTIGTSGLFSAGDTPGSGTVKATYEREGDDPLTDSAAITVIGVTITGPNSVLCRAPKPGRMPPKAIRITLEAESTPSGGEYIWSIVSGSDKVELKGENSKAVVKGVSPSDDELDVEIKVFYTLHDHICSTTHKLTVRRPASADRDMKYYNSHPTQERGLFYWRYVRHKLLDQFGVLIEVPNIPIGENLKKIEGLFLLTGQTVTTGNGTFLDKLRSIKLIRYNKWHQTLRAGCRRRWRRAQGGWDVGHFHIIFGVMEGEWKITKDPAP